MAAIARYTHFVALSKRSLWVLVAVIIGVLIWIAQDNGENGARIVFSNIAKSDDLQNVMAKPHYQGVDANNRPYTVIADKATQIDPDNIALEMVRADMSTNNGTWMALNAGSGTLNPQTKQLELHDKVNVFYEGGYEFRTDHAHVNIKEGSAYSDTKVEGQGPMGTLKANGFSVNNKEKSIRFNGSVRMTLYR